MFDCYLGGSGFTEGQIFSLLDLLYLLQTPFHKGSGGGAATN
jgi:hypothetical protein